MTQKRPIGTRFTNTLLNNQYQLDRPNQYNSLLEDIGTIILIYDSGGLRPSLRRLQRPFLQRI